MQFIYNIVILNRSLIKSEELCDWVGGGLWTSSVLRNWMLKNVQESTGGTWTCEIPLKTIHRDRKMCDVWQICASVWLRKHAASSSNGYTRCRLQLLLIWILCYTYPKLCNPITVCFPVGGNVGCDIRLQSCVLCHYLHTQYPSL